MVIAGFSSINSSYIVKLTKECQVHMMEIAWVYNQSYCHSCKKMHPNRSIINYLELNGSFEPCSVFLFRFFLFQDITKSGLLEQHDVNEWINRGSRVPPGFRVARGQRKLRKSSQLSVLVPIKGGIGSI